MIPLPREAMSAPSVDTKLDELTELLAAAESVAVRLSRPRGARAALEAGVETLLATHRRAP